MEPSLSIKGRRPTQKTTHPKKKSLHKQFAQTLLSVFCLFKREKGDSLYKLSRNCLRKLFVQTLFIWVGVFLGGSSLHNVSIARIARLLPLQVDVLRDMCYLYSKTFTGPPDPQKNKFQKP